jgi:hypothetical protein
MKRSGGCTTTAYALTVGQDSDPEINVRMELLRIWLEVVASTSVPKTALQKVWSQQQQRLAAPRKWGQVKGPLGAVLATLHDLGWEPSEPTRWTEPLGSTRQIDPRHAGVIPLVLDQLRRSCIQRVWRRAGTHWSGQGIGDAADLTALQAARKDLVKAVDWKGVAWFDLIGQGACWPPARLAAIIDSGTSPRCQFCLAEAE